MYALFLETKAAEQIDRYVAANGGDAEEIKHNAYHNAINGGLSSDWFVNECLNNDAHKSASIDSLFYWEGTQEGSDYWEGVNDY